MPLQLRRGTTSQIATIVPVPGELIYNVETGAISVGDGESTGGTAIVNITPVEIAQYTANALIDGAHSGITYELVDGVINSVVLPDLSNYAGTIEADAFKGTLVGDDSTILVDGLTNKINLDGTIKGQVVPDTTGQYSLGSSGVRFADIFLTGTVNVGSAAITNPSGSIINLPAGSTVDGVLIGSGGGGGGTLSNVVEDTTPQLGGDLDLNSSDITGTGDINITGSITATTISGDLGATLHLNSHTISGTGDINIVGAITGTTLSGDLGSNLGLNSRDITGTGNIDITGNFTTDGFISTVYGNTAFGTSSTQGGENVYIHSVTDGTSNNLNVLGLNFARTSVTAPANTLAGDFLGGVGFKGYRSDDPNGYTGAAALIAAWAGSAVFTGDNPASTLNVLTNNNGSRNVFTFAENGAFVSPILQTGNTYTTTPDTRPSTPVAGMIIFEITSNTFQGWNGSSWVTLG